MSHSTKMLPQDFFCRSVTTLAEELLGKVLIYEQGGHRKQAIITETEAYGGIDDAASHAHKGKTPRNWPMYEQGGYSYVYLIYGMHHCFNISAGDKGEGGAVLIRSVTTLPDEHVLTGPGRVGKFFGFTRAQSGYKMTEQKSYIWVEDWGYTLENVQQATRVGITKATDKMWRYLGTIARR